MMARRMALLEAELFDPALLEAEIFDPALLEAALFGMGMDRCRTDPIRLAISINAVVGIRRGNPRRPYGSSHWLRFAAGLRPGSKVPSSSPVIGVKRKKAQYPISSAAMPPRKMGRCGSSSAAISPASPINCSTPSEMVGAWLMALVRKQPRANKVTSRCSALRDQSQRFKLRLPNTRRKYASKDATPQPEPRRWCAAPSGSGFVQPQSPGHGDPVHERCRPCRRGQA